MTTDISEVIARLEEGLARGYESTTVLCRDLRALLDAYENRWQEALEAAELFGKIEGDNTDWPSFVETLRGRANGLY